MLEKKRLSRRYLYLVRDLIEVDPISLIRMGPVRVNVACRDAALIRGENEVFFNYEGR